MGSPSTDPDRAAHASTARRIAQAHAQIRDILEHVGDGSAELGRTRRLLEHLPLVLRDHFDDEERQGGLFDTLRSLRPAVEDQLKFLLRDHRSILHAVETLEGYLERLDGTEDAAERREQTALIQRETDVVIRQIQQHERVESRLTADVLYLDEGRSG